MIRTLLEQEHKMHSELFTTGFFIVYFSLRKIPKRGVPTEADNNNVDTAYFKLIHRWNKREAESGTDADLSM